MFFYNGINVNYKDYGDKNGKVIVYLHGWGQNIQMMEPIANPFQENKRLVIIDLPGFGKSEEPLTAWTLEEYAEMVYNLLKELNVDKPNLIGHSFGGKISLVYASKYEVERMILLASPFMVHKKKISLKVRILKKLAKVPFLRKFANNLKHRMGSVDYRNASPMMRDILVKHVNTDITEILERIKCPTFIIWGDKDSDVLVNDAYILKDAIKDSGLVVYPNCTHYAYLERLGQTIRIIESFMK